MPEANGMYKRDYAFQTNVMAQNCTLTQKWHKQLKITNSISISLRSAYKPKFNKTYKQTRQTQSTDAVVIMTGT